MTGNGVIGCFVALSTAVVFVAGTQDSFAGACEPAPYAVKATERDRAETGHGTIRVRSAPAPVPGFRYVFR
jgi:hypothetical protein